LFPVITDREFALRFTPSGPGIVWAPPLSFFPFFSNPIRVRELQHFLSPSSRCPEIPQMSRVTVKVEPDCFTRPFFSLYYPLPLRKAIPSRAFEGALHCKIFPMPPLRFLPGLTEVNRCSIRFLRQWPSTLVSKLL